MLPTRTQMSSNTFVIVRQRVASLQTRGGVFLTYPQILKISEGSPNLENYKARLFAQLQPLIDGGKVKSIDRGVVAREQHADGNWHLHVSLHFEMVKPDHRLYIPHSMFDLMGHHGNYQATRSEDAVMQYCAKEEDYIWWGVDPKTRADLRGKKRNLALAQLVSGLSTPADAVVKCPALLLHYDKLKSNTAMLRADQRMLGLGHVPACLLVQGPPGCGKTTLATSLTPGLDVFPVPLPSGKEATWWFDGYRGEPILLFDNISAATAPPYDLLCRIVDRLMCSVPTKGGHVQCRPRVVVITTTENPGTIWLNRWDHQMMRRLTRWLIATRKPTPIPMTPLDPLLTSSTRRLPTTNPLLDESSSTPATSPELSIESTPIRPSMGLFNDSSTSVAPSVSRTVIPPIPLPRTVVPPLASDPLLPFVPLLPLCAKHPQSSLDEMMLPGDVLWQEVDLGPYRRTMIPPATLAVIQTVRTWLVEDSFLPPLSPEIAMGVGPRMVPIDPPTGDSPPSPTFEGRLGELATTLQDQPSTPNAVELFPTPYWSSDEYITFVGD